MSEPGRLISSTRLGVNVWLILDPAFKPNDGLAWYYPGEIALMKEKTDQELRQIQTVKLAFPGSKIAGRIFQTFPELPWIVTYTEAELAEFKAWWETKYPAGNRTLFKSKDPWRGLIHEDCFERFLKATPLPWRQLSKGAGPDKVDFQVGNWMIDVKGETTAKADRVNKEKFALLVPVYQVEKEDSPINCYQFGVFNPITRQCQLYGWRLRKDLQLVSKGGIAIRRVKGIPLSDYFTPNTDENEITADQAHSEQRYVWDFPGKIK